MKFTSNFYLDQTEDLDKKKEKEIEQGKSFMNISLQRPIIHLSTAAINSLFLFFSDDPDSQDKRLNNESKKTLLKCLLKYGKIKKLLDQKKRKKRFFIGIILF